MAAIGELTPYFSFGIIGDPQYADKEDGNVEGRVQRHREVPDKLREAVGVFAMHPEALQCVLVLGDFIDGRFDEPQTKEDLELLAGIMDGLGEIPAVHVVGNHDLAFVSKDYWLTKLKTPDPGYYSRPLAPGWRLVVIDTTDLSLHAGHTEDSPEGIEARDYLKAHPLSEVEPQMSDWNGGIGAKQLKWLKAELAAAEAAGEKVITAGHHPVGEGSARSTHMAWNRREIQDVLTSSRCVVLHLQGHDHMGGYHVHGDVHFLTVEALLEAPTGSNAYATARIFPDHIEIKGVGSVRSHKLRLPQRLVQLG